MITWPTPMPPWIEVAFSYLGLREIPGKSHNKKITQWLIKLGAWWKDDETPWCGTFVGYCLDAAGLPRPKHWYRAKAYSEFGMPCPRDQIPFGAICVKSRKGGGHVFFAVAQNRAGTIIYGLGGNQANSVNITPFRLIDIDSIRYPPVSTPRAGLPIAENSSAVNASAPGGSEA